MEKKTISTPVTIAIVVGVLIVAGIIGSLFMNHANGPSLSPAEAQAQTQKLGDAQKQANDDAQQRYANGGAPMNSGEAAQKQAQDAAQQRYANGGGPPH